MALCPLCKKNGESPSVYLSHKLRDENNNIVCPILKSYTCPLCQQVGQHTMSYCPMNKKNNSQRKSLTFNLNKSNYNKARCKMVTKLAKLADTIITRELYKLQEAVLLLMPSYERLTLGRLEFN